LHFFWTKGGGKKGTIMGPEDLTAKTESDEEENDKVNSDDINDNNVHDDDDKEIDKLAKELQEKIKVTDEAPKEEKEKVDKKEEQQEAPPPSLPPSDNDDDDDAPADLKIVAEWIRSGQAKNILVVTGAGTSVAAGIPDFRSPGTGLYDNLAKYNLPFPEAIFEIGFYQKNPQPFIQLASELWPPLAGASSNDAKYKPTYTHCFLALLAQKNLLLRVYTQNIDGLDHMGTFFLQHVLHHPCALV
jgi:Sir2 family